MSDQQQQQQQQQQVMAMLAASYQNSNFLSQLFMQQAGYPPMVLPHDLFWASALWQQQQQHEQRRTEPSESFEDCLKKMALTNAPKTSFNGKLISVHSNNCYHPWFCVQRLLRKKRAHVF